MSNTGTNTTFKEKAVLWIKRQITLLIIGLVAFVLWRWLVFPRANSSEKIIAFFVLLGVFAFLIWAWWKGRKRSFLKWITLTRVFFSFFMFANFFAVGGYFYIRQRQAEEVKIELQKAEKAKEAEEQRKTAEAHAKKIMERRQKVEDCKTEEDCNAYLELEKRFYATHEADAFKNCKFAVNRIFGNTPYEWEGLEQYQFFKKEISINDGIISLSGASVKTKDEDGNWKTNSYICKYNTKDKTSSAELIEQ